MKLEPLFYVKNLQKSVNFYRGILEFNLGEYFPDKTNPTYIPVFIDNYKLMLCLARESNQKFYNKGLGGSGTQLFIQTEKVDDIWKKVKDKVEIFDNIETKPWGDREFTIKDPDGYLLTFYSTINQK